MQIQPTTSFKRCAIQAYVVGMRLNVC